MDEETQSEPRRLSTGIVSIKTLEVIGAYRTPTGVIAHETCADNFLYRPKPVPRLRIIYVILTHCSLNILIIS